MQKGAKGSNVELLQIMLNLCQPHKEPLTIDGDFGNATLKSVQAYFDGYGKNNVTFISGELYALLAADYEIRPKFIVVLDAGHGGLDPDTGLYTTPAKNGKRYQHPTSELHTKDGWFFEGVENRIIVFKTAFALRMLGFLTVIASHEYLDHWNTKTDAEELKRRGEFAAPYLRHGFNGYFHSVHSNAAPTSIKDKVTGKTIRKRTKAELDAIIGGEVYTTTANNLSDKAAPILTGLWEKQFGKAWIRGGGEKQADFSVILNAETTAKAHNSTFVAILSEFGVYTSENDCKLITSEATRQIRVESNMEFCKQVFAMIYPNK